MTSLQSGESSVPKRLAAGHYVEASPIEVGSFSPLVQELQHAKQFHVGTIIAQGKSSIFSDIRLGTGRQAMTPGGATMTRDIDLEVYRGWDLSESMLCGDEDKDAAPRVECVASPFKRYGLATKNGGSQSRR